MECIGVSDNEEYPNDGNPCEIKSNRSCTDKTFLVILALSLITLFACLGYCINHGDLDRIIKGYDDCGNICGKNNINTDNLNFQCYGKNMEHKKYLLYRTVGDDYYSRNNYVVKECVTSCDAIDTHKDIFSNRCFGSEYTDKTITSEIHNLITLYWKYLLLMSFFAMMLSFTIMLMLRYKTSSTICIILFVFSILCISITIFLWVRLAKINKLNDHKGHTMFLISSIISTVFTCVFAFIIIAMIKRLKIVTAIFKESAKAIADMPLLLLQPLATFLAICIIIICGIYTTLWITSSGHLKALSSKEYDRRHRKPGSLDYEISTGEIITMYLNYFIILWMIQFVVGCQHIIVGGSISTWFFCRNKDELKSPIKTNTYNLVRYHLGTICLGSLIITIVGIIKAIVKGLQTALSKRNSILACILYCLLKYILDLLELFLKFFSRNAYVQTAIYGYSFCQGGKRAFNLLVKNIFHVIVINSVGDYILSITKFFVVLITVLLSALILWAENNTQHMIPVLIIIGCISFFIAHSFLTVYEMAIEAIFLCFCEDCEVNDGITKPFFMSRNLMEIVEYTNKKLLEEADDN